MFRSIKRQRVSDEIVNQVKTLISEGVLKPGDRLPPERELIREFGVSRPSLREALNTLVAQGFLEVRQGNRTFVKSITSEKLQDPQRGAGNESRLPQAEPPDVDRMEAVDIFLRSDPGKQSDRIQSARQRKLEEKREAARAKAPPAKPCRVVEMKRKRK